MTSTKYYILEAAQDSLGCHEVLNLVTRLTLIPIGNKRGCHTHAHHHALTLGVLQAASLFV